MPRLTTYAAVAIAAVSLALLDSAEASASVAPTASIVAIRAPTAPPQDASFADPVWATAIEATGFENVTTETPAADATTAMILYDDTNLYVGFVAEQKSAPITTTQSTDDVGYGLDDSVTFAIDTSGANSRAYAFTATPRGVKYEYSSESSRYEPPWRVVTSLGDGAYRVLMTIPLADMKLSRSGSQNWRFNVTRRVASSGNLYSWAWNRSEFSYCQQRTATTTTYCNATGWPTLAGVVVKTGRLPPAYADAYALGSAGGDRRTFETTPQQFSRQTPRTFGVDVAVPMTNSLSMVGALGPDFSNVETDQSTIAPQEFALQYGEFRPFFAQGAGFLAPLPLVGLNGPPNRTFYTPALGIVDDGLKVEGTIGSSSVGVLDVKGDGFNDRAFGYAFKRPDGSLTLAAQGVDAEHPGLSDRTVGVGGRFSDVRSGFDEIASYARESGTNVGSTALAASFLSATDYTRGPLQIIGVYQDIGPQYAPVDGFTANNDIRGPAAIVVYNGVPKGGGLKTVQVSGSLDRYLDRRGEAHQVDTSYSVGAVTRRLVSFSASVGTSELRTYAEAYPRYSGSRIYAFDQTSLSLGFRDGTPSPIDANYSFGPFGVFCSGGSRDSLPCRYRQNGFVETFVDQLDLSTTRTLAGGLSATFEYAGTLERAYVGTSDSQWLRRIALSRPLGSSGQLSLGLRLISGTGGFALPGETIAISYQKRFANQDRLFVEYGSPASFRTLNRVILKYVHHLGKGGAGT